MFLTPSKVQLSSPPFPIALQIRPLVLRAPHTTSPWLHKSASEPRETSELSGCNNTWWEPGFCCIIPPRDWAGWRKGQGWGSQGLLSSWSWEGLSPLPKSCTGSLCSKRNVLWVGSVIWDLGGGDRGVWKRSIEGFGRVWYPFTSLGLIYLCLAGLYCQVFHHAPRHCYKCLFIALGHFPTSKA